MPVSEVIFRQRALEEPDAQWELHCGSLRHKPGMTAEHNDLALRLAASLLQQLDRDQFRVRQNSGHVRRSADRYYIPDVFVVPAALELTQRGTRRLEVYQDPLPLVVEVWSPSTGDYDVETKLVEYQRRGDREIWRLHPYEHTLTAWRRKPDGTYTVPVYGGGSVQASALPGVTIDLDALFS
jgi:Uma2 family endonuclease